MIKALIWGATIALLLTCFTSTKATAPTDKFSCEKVERFAITNPGQIYLQCNKSWPDTTAVKGSFELWQYPDNWKVDPTKGPQLYTSGSAGLWKDSNYYLELILTKPLQGDKKYILILRSSPDAIDMFIEFSTEGKGEGAATTKGAIAPSLAGTELGRTFTVTSSTNSPAMVTTSPDNPKLRKTYPVTAAIAISLKNKPDLALTEKREVNGNLIPHAADVSIQEQSSPETAGEINVSLKGGKKLRQAKAIVGLAPRENSPQKNEPLLNVLSQEIKTTDTLDLQPPPVGKDDASQYFQISHFAGVGTKPGYSINIKEKTFLFLDHDVYAGDYLIQPDILIDIGTNNFARKSDDTIKLGVTGMRTVGWFRLGPGFSYETNRGFKKKNLLFTFDTNPILSTLYQSREARRYRAAAKAGKNSLSDISEGAFPWGGGIEFFFGLEGGGSPSDQTFQNKKKTANLNVPSYSIFRLRPKVHAFAEYRRLLLDWSGTLRGLLTPEYVGEELPDTTVRLRRVSGFQAYMELTGGYVIDPSKHVSFTVTYKRGAQPPTYPHTNSVSTGITLKY
jgi:hypothetical protein